MKKTNIILLCFPLFAQAHGEDVLFVIYGFGTWIALAIGFFFIFKPKRSYYFFSLILSILGLTIISSVQRSYLILPFAIDKSTNNFLIAFFTPLSIMLISYLLRYYIFYKER